MKAVRHRPFLVIALLSLCGAVLSLYSLVQHVRLDYGLQTEPSFCNINAAFNCDAVNSSEWAAILGIPVASYGLTFYTLFLLFAAAAWRGRRIERDTALNVATVLTLGAVLFSVYLFGVSKLAIGTFCLVCIALYIINLLLLTATYLAGRPTGLVTRARAGAAALAAFPFLAFGLGRFGKHAGKNAACGALAVIVAGAAALLTMPQRIILKSALSESVSESEAAGSLDPVAEWQALAPIDIPIETAAGVKHDYAQGPADAPITIVEFSDFECPACRRFYAEIHEILQRHGESVRLVHRNFPIDQTCNVNIPRQAHMNSCFAALFARCAGEQGKFWEAVDFLFTLPAIDADEPPDAVRAAITNGAQQLSLDTTAMSECLGAERQQARIMDDIDLGMQLGLESTPAVWINGRQLKMPTGENITAIIEHVIAAKGQPAP